MRKLFAVAVVFMIGVLASPFASAHAFLDHAVPRVGSEGASPTLVTLWFTEEVESAFSHVTVSNASGLEVDKKDVRVDPTDATKVTVTVPLLPPGVYTVKWSVVSVDTHHTSGKYTFIVK